MTYQLTPTSTIHRISDDAFIPPDPGNTDYAAYMAWLAKGNTPLPAPAHEPPPEPTPAEKLARAGLTIAELRELLGLD